MTTSVLYNTTTITTGAHPVTSKKTSKNILVTCLHLDDVDIKDGECYMLNLPQPCLPTLTIFDGTTLTFPEWVRELRAYLNISQLEHIDHLDFAYIAEQPLTTDIMVQHAPEMNVFTSRSGWTSKQQRHRRQDHTDHQQPQCTTNTSGCNHNSSTSRRSTSWLPHHACDQAEQRTKQPTTSTTAKNIGWETHRQLRHQCAAGARVQQYALLQSTVHPQP